jgi:hypothetical protein
VEITVADSCSHDASLEHCLLFTPGPVRLNSGPLPGIRRMQPPFLASTLGPLLMEMALERRLNSDQ